MSATGLPDGVSYDGPQTLIGATLLQFTDTGETGTSFYLPPAEATPERIAVEVAQRRAAFARGPRAEDVHGMSLVLAFLQRGGSPLVPPAPIPRLIQEVPIHP